MAVPWVLSGSSEPTLCTLTRLQHSYRTCSPACALITTSQERQRLLRDLYEQQGRDIEQQLAASSQSIEVLRAQRDALSARGGGGGASGRNSGRNAAAAEEAARLEAAVKVRLVAVGLGLNGGK